MLLYIHSICDAILYTMKHLDSKRHTIEDATRFGARSNAYLGAAQLVVGAISGNVGFMTESAHQAADSFSLKAKADAMNHACIPEKAHRLRKLAAKTLLAGGLAGIGGGAYHFATHSRESSEPIEVGAAVIGAAVNIAIAKKTHGAEHDNDGHEHHSHGVGAATDTILHVVTDMGTGTLYAASLALENRFPGITNYTLIS